MYQNTDMISSNNQTRVSVIIPVYNSAAYLNRTIRCLQEQFFKEIEVIFVDDSSTDDSVSIIQQFMKDDPRIKLLQNDTHQSAGVCRNCGLKIATGEYVIFLDSDDYFYPNMFEIAYKRVKLENADVAVFGREVVDMTLPIDEYGIPSIKYDLYENRVVYGEEARIRDYSQGAFIPWNKLVRRQFILDNEIQFQDLPSNNDIYYSFSVITSAEKIVYIDSILIRYYKSLPASLTSERVKQNYLPEAISNCISYAQKHFYSSNRYKKVNEYLLKIIKREIVSGADIDVTAKVGRFIQHQNVLDWIDSCIKNKIFNNEDLLFLQALKLNHIESNMAVEKLEALRLSKFVEELHHSNKKVALWGCGKRGLKWLELIKRNKINIDYVIDESENIQGKNINGFVVRSYKSVKNDIDVILLMIANPSIVSEIKKLAEDHIVLEEGEWIDNV